MRPALWILASLTLLLPAASSAQKVEEVPTFPASSGQGTSAQDSIAVLDPGADISPLGAFLRAAALPAWGHSAIGSYRRGAFYTVAEAGTVWMLFRTISRKRSAERTLESRQARVRAEIAFANPELSGQELEDLVDTAFDNDPVVQDGRNRVIAREGQFEDWVAMGIFLTFLSGADAFVSQHLRDFPDPIDVNIGPTPEGGVQVAARIRLGALRRR